MDQPVFADQEFQNKKGETRRELLLERMDVLLPWQRLQVRIRPIYLKEGRELRPYDLSVMLRVHCGQVFYSLSDPGMEDLHCVAESVRRFEWLRLTDSLTDGNTILHFRHLLERRDPEQGLFAEINEHPAVQGLRLNEGTIVDASIIEEPSSTKNRTGQRDREL